jgi:hypothetical protein
MGIYPFFELWYNIKKRIGAIMATKAKALKDLLEDDKTLKLKIKEAREKEQKKILKKFFEDFSKINDLEDYGKWRERHIQKIEYADQMIPLIASVEQAEIYKEVYSFFKRNNNIVSFKNEPRLQYNPNLVKALDDFSKTIANVKEIQSKEKVKTLNVLTFSFYYTNQK